MAAQFITLLLYLTPLFANATPTENEIRAKAGQIWGAKSKQHPGLVDYRICQDFESCFKKDCEKNLKEAGTFREFKSASRPFVMASKTQPARGTVMLAHGWSDSPYTFGAAAEELSKKGYNVVTILLTGHGADFEQYSDNSAKNKVAWSGDFVKGWRQDFANGVKLAKELFPATDPCVGGFSTGGLLAVDYMQNAKKSTIQPACGILFDPALDLPGIAELSVRKTKLNDLLRWREGEVPQHSNPSRVPLSGVQHARPIQYLIDFVNRGKDTKINTPTVAIFSNGKAESGRLGTVDAAKGREALDGMLTGPKQLIDYGKYGMRHNDIPVGKNFGNCAASARKDLGNSKFKEMMTGIDDFMTANLQPRTQTATTPAPTAQ